MRYIKELKNKIFIFVSISLALAILGSCHKVNLDFMLENSNSNYDLPLDKMSTVKRTFNPDDDNMFSAELLPITFTQRDEEYSKKLEINEIVKGQYYKSWKSVSSADIQPISDSSVLKDRPFTENALTGVEVFIDAGLSSSRQALSISYGDKTIGEKDIYTDIAKLAAYSLESLGAKVTILSNEDAKEIRQYARIFTAAATLFKEIKNAYINLENPDELYISRLDEYLSKINTIILKNDDRGNSDINKSPRSFVQGLGASEEQRFYLDTMAKLDHAIYIQLKLCDVEEDRQAGYSVHYLNNDFVKQADETNAHYYSNLDPNEYYPQNPSYQFYNDAKRARLATCLDMEMRSYCPSLNNNLPERKTDTASDSSSDISNIEISDNLASRILNIPVVSLKLGLASDKNDAKALLNETERYYVSKAITNAVYKYFCE